MLPLLLLCLLSMCYSFCRVSLSGRCLRLRRVVWDSTRKNYLTRCGMTLISFTAYLAVHVISRAAGHQYCIWLGDIQVRVWDAICVYCVSSACLAFWQFIVAWFASMRKGIQSFKKFIQLYVGLYMQYLYMCASIRHICTCLCILQNLLRRPCYPTPTWVVRTATEVQHSGLWWAQQSEKVGFRKDSLRD